MVSEVGYEPTPTCVDAAEVSSTFNHGHIMSCTWHLGTSNHGIPDILLSDNGPQFSAIQFQDFAKSYGFTHTTSSSYLSQVNGGAERAVGIAKKIK